MIEPAQKFTPVEKTLANGKKITIRECNLADVSDLTHCIQQYISDSEHIPLTSKEFNPSEAYRMNWIRSFMEEQNSLLLAATHENTIIGNIDITGGNRERFKHTGIIGMGLLKEWRGMGVGSLLLDAAIEWAKNTPEIEILWLQVYADNIAGVNLYHKKGFLQTGVQHNFIKLGDDKYADNLIMQLSVK